MSKPTMHVILAPSESEGYQVATALRLSLAIYADDDLSVAAEAARANGHPITLVRVEGWERGHQSVDAVSWANHYADDEMEVPTTDLLRYGMERAERAAESLARIRDAKTNGSPFLGERMDTAVRKTESDWQRVARFLIHKWGACPTRKAGLECGYPPATCRWAS